jgi:hypothetical protein
MAAMHMKSAALCPLTRTVRAPYRRSSLQRHSTSPALPARNVRYQRPAIARVVMSGSSSTKSTSSGAVTLSAALHCHDLTHRTQIRASRRAHGGREDAAPRRAVRLCVRWLQPRGDRPAEAHAAAPCVRLWSTAVLRAELHSVVKTKKRVYVTGVRGVWCKIAKLLSVACYVVCM